MTAHHQGVDGHRNNPVDQTPKSRKRKSHAERASKEGRCDQDSLWDIFRRNKVWFCRSDHAVSRLLKEGYHTRCSVDISSTWHPCHVWPHHLWKHKWYQQDKERDRMGSPLRGTWSLPQGRVWYEALHHQSIRCVLARGNQGRRPWFHPQDSKINAGAPTNSVHETHQSR